MSIVIIYSIICILKIHEMSCLLINKKIDNSDEKVKYKNPVIPLMLFISSIIPLGLDGYIYDVASSILWFNYFLLLIIFIQTIVYIYQNIEHISLLKISISFIVLCIPMVVIILFPFGWTYVLYFVIKNYILRK